MIMGSQELERRESRKRRRLSERRRVFSRIGLGASSRAGFDEKHSTSGSTMATESGSWSSVGNNNASNWRTGSNRDGEQRSESPLSLFGSSQSGNKISMKIQFHITVAPENEPLILEPSQLLAQEPAKQRDRREAQQVASKQKSTDSTSIGDQIHERLLNRQNTLSTRRRQQLLALHNQPATDGPGPLPPVEEPAFRSMPERLASGRPSDVSAVVGGAPSDGQSSAPVLLPAPVGREPGARSSTITGGIADEATIKFLANHHKQQQLMANPLRLASLQAVGKGLPAVSRELIYFKRDGQRFGHEFTLKLSVERTYRCLLKIRPLFGLQAISIQGHQALFVDCNQPAGGALATSSSQSTGSVFFQAGSAPASTTGLNRSWQNIHNGDGATSGNAAAAAAAHRKSQTAGRPLATRHQASDSFLLLQQQQQNQMMRHFAASHISSANPHLGAQLVYMFDWPASRFKVNKNNDRTQVHTVLKFKNGQILSLPLQVKFYQPECRQHLSWGNQLHFIDYDCSINSLGQIKVDRVQFY